jgi:hypothetical protein
LCLIIGHTQSTQDTANAQAKWSRTKLQAGIVLDQRFDSGIDLTRDGLGHTISSKHNTNQRPEEQKEDDMKWITRSHVHVDRVACPWLISRFVDSDAEFLFVPESQVKVRAEQENAIPFDIVGVELGHVDGCCSFESIIKKYQLKDRALQRLAKIVHAADVDADRLSDAIAPGLEAIAVGFSLRFPDDYENLELQYEVYDALYAWCRLEVSCEKA